MTEARSSPMIVATAPSIFSVDFSVPVTLTSAGYFSVNPTALTQNPSVKTTRKNME